MYKRFMIICTYDLHIYILGIVKFGCEALFYQLKKFKKVLKCFYVTLNRCHKGIQRSYGL